MKLTTLKLGYPDLRNQNVVYTALLEHGLFTEKAPNCFVSKGLQSAPEPYFYLQTGKNRSPHSYIVYQATRNTNIPRSCGIPHPEAHKFLCTQIKENWSKINEFIGAHSNGESRCHVRRIGDGSVFALDDYEELVEIETYKNYIFDLNEKGSFADQDRQKGTELRFAMNAKFVVKTDISNFFPSIYSHSVEWAIHGKATSKDNRSNWRNHWGYDLDSAQRNTTDNETNGILIGPHTSNIVSEIILCKVDSVLRSKGYDQFFRYIDDYTFYAENHEQAKAFLHEFTLALKEFELFPNEKKTSIESLRDVLEEGWVLELRQFRFPSKGQIYFSIIESFFNRARHLQKQYSNSSLLSYAITIIQSLTQKPALKFNQSTKSLYLQLTYSLSLQFPYLCQFLDERVLECFYEGLPEQCTHLERFVIRLLEDSSLTGNLGAIAHGLHIALKHKIILDLEPKVTERILKSRDCVSLVLLHRYAKERSDDETSKNLEAIANEILSGDRRDQDRHWLLLYECCSQTDLYSNGQYYLAKLKEDEVKFINIDEE